MPNPNHGYETAGSVGDVVRCTGLPSSVFPLEQKQIQHISTAPKNHRSDQAIPYQLTEARRISIRVDAFVAAIYAASKFFVLPGTRIVVEEGREARVMANC